MACVFAAAPASMAQPANIESELREFIENEQALHAVFGTTARYWSSDRRADASATHDERRHAIVMYRKNSSSSGLGQMFCHAALGRRERDQWLDRLAVVANGDRLVAQHLATAASPSIRFKRNEYSPLPDWNNWQLGVCHVAETDIQAEYPSMPDAASVRAATYEVGKRLYAAGSKQEALERFKTLKSDNAIYPNALLFIVAILHETHPDIADQLDDRHVDISKADDLDALNVYARVRSGVTEQPTLDEIMDSVN